ncbi:MAG TPA: cysteine desulfurase family protein [Rhizomicrobium sp.]|nr:cysteine desulfurase family protein [Rhizomicrobium sp.]
MTYLDHNATSPLRPEARVAMQNAFGLAGNPSAIHASGRAARAVVENAREQVAALVNANANDIVFTSGGSEANALALWGAVQGAAASAAPIKRLVISAIEHDSVLKVTEAIAERSELECVLIPANGDGVVEVGELEKHLNSTGRALVAVMAANNETGVVQPVAAVASRVHSANGFLLVDAVQACGKMAINFSALGADYMTLSAHKFGGPQGAGALVVKASAPFAAQIPGNQEKGRRGGTENVISIAGFGAAAECVVQDEPSQTACLRARFENALRARFPDVVIFGEASPRIPNTSNFAVPGIPAETAVIALDLDGVMVSSGAACSSGKVRQSHVLEAMGVPGALASCGLRVSFGWNSNASDIDAALAGLDRLVARVRERKAA